MIHAALENPRLTESAVIKALMRRDAPAAVVAAVCGDSRWSARREIRIALLHNENTPPARALEFARSLPAELVREVLHDSRLAEAEKERLLNDVEEWDETPGGKGR